LLVHQIVNEEIAKITAVVVWNIMCRMQDL
jgi:hypothetical protein